MKRGALTFAMHSVIPLATAEEEGALSEMGADCFYSLFRELFLTLSHRCLAIIKKKIVFPAQLRLLEENV